MKVEALMMQGAATCRTDDSGSLAAMLMWERDCGAVPVVDEEDRVVAMVTDRDLCIASYLEGEAIRDIPVVHAMSRELWTCRRNDDVADAEQLMREHRVRRLPVVDAQGRLEGILSLSDLVREASKGGAKSKKDSVSYQEIGETLSDISVPHDDAIAVLTAS